MAEIKLEDILGQHCDIEAYRMLRACKTYADVEAFNKWRLGHSSHEIHLSGAYLMSAFLDSACLNHASLENANLMFSNLENAELVGADMENANMVGVNLECAELDEANLRNTDLLGAKFNCARLSGANLENAYLENVDLEYADLGYANLENADLEYANLKNTNLEFAQLENTNLENALLENTDLTGSHVSEKTVFFDCKVNRNTNARYISLDIVRIEAETRVLLRYNMRRMSWEDWYRSEKDKAENPITPPQKLFRQMIRLFWWASDYGRSPGRVVKTFFLASLAFSLLYCLCDWCGFNVVYDAALKDSHLSFGRAFYFSIVTMTTLGFGDLYVEPTSRLGHLLLCLHVTLGYVLLGSLITVLTHYFNSECAVAYFPDEAKSSWGYRAWQVVVWPYRRLFRTKEDDKE